MRRLVAAALVVLVACAQKKPAPSVDASSSAPSASTRDGRMLVAGACLSCHSDEMLAQQRLTPTQWSKVVTKMVSWGAPLEPGEVAPLTDYLSANFGPDAGSYEPAPIAANEANLELAAQDDGPFAGGDAARGGTIYLERCSACHGPDARGALGVRLIERPFLYRATDFANTVRHGRGKMPPLSLADRDIGDLLSHLRALR